MSAEWWRSLERPGDCITVFTPRLATSTRSGLLVRWRFFAVGDFDPDLIDVLGGPEIEQAFLDATEVVRDALGTAPGGIRMFDEDRTRLRRERVRLDGGSLGLAFMLGALGREQGAMWPANSLAWGSLAPLRDGTFGVLPVDALADKVVAAQTAGAALVLHPAEQAPEGWHGRALGVPRAAADSLAVLKHIFSGGGS